jgi:poly-gamma-glutamate synthesis protein (capsule biosynthesis protein)
MLMGCGASPPLAGNARVGLTAVRHVVAEAAASVTRRAAATAPAPQQTNAERSDWITISAVGDCAIGDLEGTAGAPGSFAHRLAQVSDPMRYPFSGIGSIFHDDDLTIANFEGTLSDSRLALNKVFPIRGKPGYATMLPLAGIDVVDVDNNHSGDFGERGYEDTLRALDAAGIESFGRGRVDRRRIKGIEVVNLGFLGGRPESTLKSAVRAVKREKKPDNLVIVSFHWGVESLYAVHPEQKQLGHAVVDAGADLVLGHHPHVLQGIEQYKGRPIVYSLANFVFGANSQPEDNDSIIYQARFRVEQGVVVERGERIIPVRTSGDPRINDFRPVLLDGAKGERVMNKLDALSGKLRG